MNDYDTGDIIKDGDRRWMVINGEARIQATAQDIALIADGREVSVIVGNTHETVKRIRPQGWIARQMRAGE